MPQAPDERLICAAHAIFSMNSVHEVIDLDRESPVERLIDFYGPELDMEKVDRYLAVVEELRIYLCDSIKDDGKESIKVDALQVGPNLGGWLVISERWRNKGGESMRS